MIQDFIYSAIRQIVIDWPVEPQYERINSFFVLNADGNWNADNAGKTYEDYENGHYWTRKGVSRNKNTFEYGAVAVECLTGVLRDPDKGLICNTFEISIGRQKQCLGCPSNKVTQLYLEKKNINDLAVLLMQLWQYGYYKFEKDDEEIEVYLPKYRRQCYLDAGYTLISECDALQIDIQDNPLSLDVSRFEGVDDIVTASTRITACGCVDTLSFNCDATLPPGEAVTHCIKC